MIWKDYIPSDISEKYEIIESHHAAAILACEFPKEFGELCEVLRTFKLKKEDIEKKGGNESNIPKRFSEILRPLGWKQDKLIATIVVDGKEITSDTHKVDYIKSKVAFDLEWNSKDQTFDRDLYAFRTFFDYNKISVAVLVTRSNDLDLLFKEMGPDIKRKYGASTTHIAKLEPRLRAGRNGGCPVLVFGISRKVIED